MSANHTDKGCPHVIAYEQTYTISNGCPFVKPKGIPADGRTLALNDHHLVETLAHFNREKIPERAVHAKGAGAYGEFEVMAPMCPTAYDRILNCFLSYGIRLLQISLIFVILICCWELAKKPHAFYGSRQLAWNGDRRKE